MGTEKIGETVTDVQAVLGSVDTGLIIQKINEVFAPMAEALGEGATFVWDTVSRQMFAEGVVGVLAFIGSSLGLAWIYKKTKQSNVSESEGFFLVIIGAIAIISSVIATFFIGESILKLINPDFFAIKFFVELAI